MASDTCYGCGQVNQFHPWVAIIGDGEIDGEFVSESVCHRCWLEPDHRKQKIVGHFFPRSDEKRALAEAGSDHIRA